jgi:hypothetical protein
MAAEQLALYDPATGAVSTMDVRASAASCCEWIYALPTLTFADTPHGFFFVGQVAARFWQKHSCFQRCFL